MTSPKDQVACIFCTAATATDEEQSLVVYRRDEALVMLNRYPYSNGHLMVAPTAHLARFHESSDSLLLPLIRLTAEAQRILSDTYHPHGFNIGMNLGEAAGAGVADHYHMHVVARWNGDSNFMTVTAQTRLVPETLDETYRKLKPQFDRLGVGP